MSEELKSCPFCSDDGDVRLVSQQLTTLDGSVNNTAYVMCAQCDASGPYVSEPLASFSIDEVENLAIELWNRATERTCHAELDEVTETKLGFDVTSKVLVCSECRDVFGYASEFANDDELPNYCSTCGARLLEYKA